MVHRNSIYERQLKLGSTRALACSDWPPRQSAMLDTTNQKSPCSSLFQDIPAFAPGGEGYQMANFIQPCARTHAGQSVSHPATNTLVGTRASSGRLVVSPIASPKSPIENSSRPAIVAF